MPYKDKEKQKQYNKQRYQDNPEYYKEKQKQRGSTSEYKEKRRQYNKQRYQDNPEYYRQRNSTPEYKEKQKQRRSTSEYKEKQKQRRSTSEYKEKQRQYNITKRRQRQSTLEFKEKRRRWNATPEQIEKRKKYHATPECKERAKQRSATLEFKEKRRRWDATPEHKEYHKQRNATLKYKETRNKRHRIYQTNFMYRLNKNISSGIFNSLKTNNFSKNGRHWETLVNFTLQELKFHLETQFDSNMNWENHGSYWHVDHIIPLASLTFDSEEHENFKLLWSLGNLQPLFGPENLSKSKKIVINFKSLLFPFTAQPVKDKY